LQLNIAKIAVFLPAHGYCIYVKSALKFGADEVTSYLINPQPEYNIVYDHAGN